MSSAGYWSRRRTFCWPRKSFACFHGQDPWAVISSRIQVLMFSCSNVVSILQAARQPGLTFFPHRQVVFVIPKMLRIFFKYNRRLLGELCRCALRSLTRYFEVLTGSELMPGVIAAIQTFGARINFHPHLHFLVTEGGVERLSLDERDAPVGSRYGKEAKDLERMDSLE